MVGVGRGAESNSHLTSTGSHNSGRPTDMDRCFVFEMFHCTTDASGFGFPKAVIPYSCSELLIRGQRAFLLMHCSYIFPWSQGRLRAGGTSPPAAGLAQGFFWLPGHAKLTSLLCC